MRTHWCTATCADNAPVTHLDLAGQRNAVGDDAVVAHHVVVGDVHVGHDEVVVTHDGLAARGGAAADGHILADVVVVADFGGRDLSGELQVLRQAGNRSGRMDFAPLADAGAVVNHGAGANPAVVADDHVAGNAGKGLDGDVGTEFRVGMYVC